MGKENHSTAIEIILEQIVSAISKLDKIIANYADGSGPRLTYEAETKAHQEKLQTLCDTLVKLTNPNNKESDE